MSGFRENNLMIDRHAMLCMDVQVEQSKQSEFDYLKTHFCGNVFEDIVELNKFLQNVKDKRPTMLYVCGNVADTYKHLGELTNVIVNIVEDYSTNINNDKLITVSVGEVPVNVHGVGVYFRKLFNSDKNYYETITKEHEFQSLTESNKAGTAYRKGIYLTKITEDVPNHELKFKLLRCSSNFDGPTDNVRETDKEVMSKVNLMTSLYFSEKHDLNHVLAQTYHNKLIKVKDGVRQRKAKISEHSDKTKDMPRSGLIAFCTFYKEYENGSFRGENLDKLESRLNDSFDYSYGNEETALTRLRFRLKKEVTDPNYTKQFDVTLYPNSVFVISLITNRLYTHEIIPSSLTIDRIPTRMGYVIRCSNTDAVFARHKTFICRGQSRVELEPPTRDEVKLLKTLYYKENVTTELVEYEGFNFSLNEGDYVRPLF